MNEQRVEVSRSPGVLRALVAVVRRLSGAGLRLVYESLQDEQQRLT